MTSRASDARVCSPPDSAVGGFAHSSRREAEPGQRRVDPLVQRVAAEDLVAVQEVRVGRLDDAAVALERRPAPRPSGPGAPRRSGRPAGASRRP